MLVWRKGVFCLEAEWFGLNCPISVRPALEFLSACDYRIPTIFRDVATAAELRHYLRKWLLARHEQYPILWLSIHTRRGLLLPGDIRRPDEKISLDQLEEWLSGKCAGRIIHFGGCRTLDLPRSRIARFLRVTKAAGVSGFCAEVDWAENTLFEMEYFVALQRERMNAKGLGRVKRRLRTEHGVVARRMGFVLHVR